MLKIISVKGENFRSFKKFDFQIKEGLWVVKGTNKDDSASDSNGSGKSTLFCDSIIWCLTGNTVEGLDNDDDVVNFKTNKDCLVEVVLNDNEHITKITRTRKHSKLKNNLFLEIDGQSLSAHRVKDTQDRVNQIIKISPALLKSTIIMAGDISNRFSELTPKDRIALLESVRDYKVWSDFRDESKESLTQYSNEITALKEETVAKESAIETMKGFIESLSNDLINESNKTFSKDEINELEQQVQIYSEKKTNKEEIDNIQRIIEEKNINLSTIESEHRKKTQELNKLYSDNSRVKYALNESTNNIEKITKLLTTDSVCPTCGQKVVMSDEKRNSLIKDLQQWKQTYIKSSCEEKELNEKISAASVVEPQELPIIRKEIMDLSIKIQELKSEDKFVSDKILSLKDKIRILNDNILSHNKIIENLGTKINSYKSEILNLSNIVKENKEKLIALDEEKEAYQFFYDSLGPRGNLRPYLLRKDITYLNSVLQYYTSRLYSGCSIKLTVPTIESNKIDILFENANGMVKPVSVLSKGERKRLDLCLQFAIYDLVKSTAMFDTNILILDEIFESLDVVGINHVVNMLEERSETIPSIYVISHNPNAYDLIPRQILVSKSNDVSKVVFKDVSEKVEVENSGSVQ